MRIVLFFLFAWTCFFACKTDHTPYAIKEFRKELQPYLVRLVTKGYVDRDDATEFVEKQASTVELWQLLQCEHPLLRAMAGRALLRRREVDHFDLIMRHLDDTALVMVDWGEWGLRQKRVSDDLVDNGRWKTEEARMKTLEAIVTRHDYLASAYYSIHRMRIDEKYYPFIREMALRERPMEEQESALYALARYKKQQDIEVIKDILLSRGGLISDESLSLMGNFPDTAYLVVLQRYFRWSLYRNICRDKTWNPQVVFFKVIAAYKNDSSAKILTTILNRQPFMPCSLDSVELKDQVITAILDNPCDAYAALRKRFAGYVKKKEEEQRRREKWDTTIDTSNSFFPRDTSSESVRWY